MNMASRLDLPMRGVGKREEMRVWAKKTKREVQERNSKEENQESA